ncbi:MAG TPA: polysaccharide ABC transporter ATP-binding protein [Candidatus Dormibacteraeota bacterium]|nr:polysaccharide ABC transporter ATP-binding protein [Candidatus Dormibacteraeota bacterium]
MQKVAIHSEGLGKRFAIGERARYVALRDVLANAMNTPRRLFGWNRRSGENRSREQLWALRDVSIDINEGEIVGLIGRNGAGKTTLLKILSRVTRPTTGFAEVHGRMGSLLEVGTGFHPELTGRENVFLSGAILGMRKREIERKFDEIVAFAEVDKFIDTPLKHFSTGMQMRLAFAVAAQLEPEILLVDEVLAVGDLEFQKKCLGKMSEVSKGGRTIVFVSHQMSQIRRLCERVIWVDHGVVQQDGPTLDVVSAYERAFTERTEVNAHGESSGQRIQFLKWELVVEDGAPSNVLKHFDPVNFRVVIHLPEAIRKGSYAIQLCEGSGQIMWHGNFDLFALGPGTFEFLHHLPTLPIKPGAYNWKAGVYDGHRWTDVWWAVPELVVGTKPITSTADEFQGILNLPYTIEVRSLEVSREQD